MDNEELDNNMVEALEAMEYAPKYHQWILDDFSKYIGKNIIEVGSGPGSISKKLIEYNPEKLFCIEPSKMIFEKLKITIEKIKIETKDKIKITPLNNFLSDSADNLQKEDIDTIIYINVLEHIEDDLGELKIMNNTLSDSGHILIFVPALQWIYGTHDKNCGHFRRYYKKDLKQKIEEAGFEVVSIKYFDFLGILPWWFTFRVLKIKYLKNGQSQIYDKLVVPITRFIEKLIPPRAGKNLIVIAKKIK